MMQRTNDLCTAQRALNKRTTVVRTSRTDRIKLIANTNKQNACRADGDLFHLSGFEVSSVREVNVFEAHCFLSGHTHEVAHLLLLSLQVTGEEIVRFDCERHTLDNFQTSLPQRLNLRRVVGHNAHRTQTELEQYFRTLLVAPQVCVKTKPLVRFDRVGAFVLQAESSPPFRIDNANLNLLKDVIAVLELRIGIESDAAASIAASVIAGSAFVAAAFTAAFSASGSSACVRSAIK